MLTNITPTTELEAVNAVLRGLGEAPIATLEDAQTDVETILGFLREATREVQAHNWRFNTQSKYRLAPTGTYSWDGTTLNIFTPPANAMRAEPYGLTEGGSHDPLNVTVRQAERYTAGSPAVKPLVFFDLTLGRDGFEDRDHLLIDVVWAFDFVGCPEVVRRFVTVVAGRRAAGNLLGNPDRVGLLQRDEASAYRELVRSQKPVGSPKFLNPRELHDARGRRPSSSFLYPYR
jgi:hypothetical protein